jgi:hypothetical protein
MFSRAVSVWIRLKAWKMKPTLRRRSFVRSASLSDSSVSPPICELPSVSRSRPAMQCMSVDLPEPDGPMMAVNPPRCSSKSMPSIARTAVSPLP